MTTTAPPSEEKVSLMQLAENSMAHTMLVFLMADLRTLSATGKIRTKFEHLSIDNDEKPRECARDFAGFAELPLSHRGGVTSAHIMAVLLLEITRELEELQHLPPKSRRQKRIKRMNDQQSLLLVEQDYGEPRPFTLNRDDIQAASDMPALLHCYNDMIAADISTEPYMVSKLEWPLDPLECETASARSENFAVTADFDPEVLSDDDDDGEKLFRSFDDLFEDYFGWSRPTFNWQEYARSTRATQLLEFENVNEHIFPNTGSDHNEEYHDNDGLVSLLEQAVEKRDVEKLGFLHGFFKKDSLCSLLLHSTAEIVWLSDWHSAHECMYAISIDKEKKQVLLSFRGSKSRKDSVRAYDMNFTSTGNPVEDNYENRPKYVKIRGRFHKYLFRVRKDTGTTKYDEIISKLTQYYRLMGEGARVLMTGHSIGAALATLVAFYASTDACFTQNGAIEVVTFGCPYIGGFKFADAVRYQESVGKLRIARFHNARDGVAHLPPTLFSISKRGAIYFYNGMDIRLPMVRKGVFKLFGQPQPKISYNGRKSFFRSLLRQIKDWYFFNLPVRLWLKSKMHPLVEHKNRILLVKLMKDPETHPLIRYSLEEIYEKEMGEKLR